MPVSGQELASLDFANLIGGPLNAVVEAQAKSAISTANFIKEVGFDKDGKVVNVDFTYNRRNENGSEQEYTLSLPFLTMLPVPYITINSAVIEFNAKITSTTESRTTDNFKTEAGLSAGGSYWFVSAKVSSKTSYQRKSARSDKEERTFDMHVRVEAQNEDMPAGTERILTLLENCISEKTSNRLLTIGARILDFKKTSKEGETEAYSKDEMEIDCPDLVEVADKATFKVGGSEYTIEAKTLATKEQPATVKITGKDDLHKLKGKTISIEPSPAPPAKGGSGGKGGKSNQT
jgi:hypothetical protein